MSLIIPTHIGIIMDGNRRWAKSKGLPTQLGHSQGAKTLEKIATLCQEKGVKYLTVYAFSTENWNRSDEEVNYLMELMAENIKSFDNKFKNKDVRIKLVGDINGLPEKLQQGIKEIEERTKNKTGLTVNVAINYGGRAEMINAIKLISDDINKGLVDKIDEKTVNKYLYTSDSPDPDLIIRTAGECRLSGFLLWQSAYSELYFTNVTWPDFDEKELNKAIEDFNNRKRNFGK